MNGLGTLLIVGIAMYFLFSRNGGMGCCGGHSHHGTNRREPQNTNPQDFPQNRKREQVVDLKPDEYKVITERVK